MWPFQAFWCSQMLLQVGEHSKCWITPRLPHETKESVRLEKTSDSLKPSCEPSTAKATSDPGPQGVLGSVWQRQMGTSCGLRALPPAAAPGLGCPSALPHSWGCFGAGSGHSLDPHGGS